MISAKMVREFLLPYMDRVAKFVKARGVRHIHLDTDGDCRSLIPLFLEVGVTGMWPFEQTGSIDLLAIRQQYPTLLMAGGIPKVALAQGKSAIDKAIEPVNEMLRRGGYIPHADHFVPPDVSLADFTYYRWQRNQRIDSKGG
jgi:uroporphyrinogen decarboxylase